MPSLKLRYLYLFLIVTPLLIIWASRTQLAEIAISRSMHDYGLQDVSIDIRQLGPVRSHISDIAFSVATETGPVQLEAHDISVNYTLQQLVNGHIDKLTVNTILLSQQNSAKTHQEPQLASEALAPIRIIAALRQAIREYLFVNSFTIDHISLQGEPFGVLQHRPFRLLGNNENGGLHAEITLQGQHPLLQQDQPGQQVIVNLAEDTIAIELRLAASPDPVPASLHLDIHDTDITGNYQIIPRQLANWLQPFINLNSVNEIEKVSGTVTANFESADHIIANLSAISDKIAYNAYAANNVVIGLNISIPTSWPDQSIRFLNGCYIKTGNFGYESFTLDDTRINIIGELTSANSSWQFSGDINSSRALPAYERQALQLENIAVRISADADKLKLSGNFTTANTPGAFTFSLQHSFTTASGQFTIDPSTPLDLNADKHKLSQLITPWAYPFDLLAGHINLSTTGKWSQARDFALTAGIKLDDVGGNYGEIVFSGLSLNHELELLPNIQSVRSSSIDLKHLDSGVSASNIGVNITIKSAHSDPLPRLVIRDLRGEIFEGTFSGDDFIFDLNRSKNSFKIKATNIDLAAIVETQQLEDIKVTGRIDGTIPVVINEQGVFIEHGSFINKVRNGTIRYNPATGTEQLKQNPLTGIALDALRDFRYSHLSAEVNFTPQGLLTINLQLKGTSPELDTNRPVHLNINTEQNLLSLLKSLRYAEGVSTNIDLKVRRQYEKTRKNK